MSPTQQERSERDHDECAALTPPARCSRPDGYAATSLDAVVGPGRGVTKGAALPPLRAASATCSPPCSRLSRASGSSTRWIAACGRGRRRSLGRAPRPAVRRSFEEACQEPGLQRISPARRARRARLRDGSASSSPARWP